MPRKKTTVPLSGAPKDVCHVVVDDLGKMVEANIQYISNNHATSPYLMSAFGKMLKEEYPKSCSMPFEKMVGTIQHDIAKQIQKDCVALPNASAVVKCAVKIENSHPIIWQDKLMTLVLQEQMAMAQRAQEMGASLGDSDRKPSGKKEDLDLYS